jgi:hypothetical protein
MPKYEVRVDERLTHSVEVEAESEQEAVEIGWNIVMNHPDNEYATESNGTTVTDVWEVK